MRLSLVLPLRNQSELTGLLHRIYDPSSADYRKFLSVAEFTERFAPSAADYQVVVEYAEAQGLTVMDRPANRLVVPVSGTVAQVEKAFNVVMKVYWHPTEDRVFFSPDREPSLELSVPLAHIAGLNNYSIPRPAFVKRAKESVLANAAGLGSGPGGSYLGSDMRAAYYGGTALTGSGQTVGLLEFDGYYASDVSQTFNNGGQSSSVPVNNVLIDTDEDAPAWTTGEEDVLDIVQAIGMAPGLSQVRVYIGNRSEAVGLGDADILNAIATENIAKQISISWSWNPDDPATDDIFFQELAAQGQSVFVASGDFGEYNPSLDSFYPAEDAFVTTVGGTNLTTNGLAGSWRSETAWDQSGGGISPDGIPIPNWQIGTANAANGGSSTLRNVPDVAMEANQDNYNCAEGICTETLGGTSFAAPRWAGFMALVNQQAAESGDPYTGFLNPTLYAISKGSSYGKDLHDITVGNNDYDVCCGLPYSDAAVGYDLVTGWGSPSGQSLIDALAPPASAGFQLAASPSILTVVPASSGMTTVTIKDAAGFSGSVNLAVSGLPNGVSASWVTNPAIGISTLTLSVSSSAIHGSYLLTITGTSGAQTADTSVVLAVDAPGFALQSSSVPTYGGLPLYPGLSASSAITVIRYGQFEGTVNLAVTSPLPPGVSANVSTDPTTGNGTLLVTADDSAPSTSAEIIITGTSGSLTATASVALTVNPAEFNLVVSPIPNHIVQDGTVTAILSLAPEGDYMGTVALSAPALPSGVTATFDPVSIALGETSQLTLSASSSAAIETSQVSLEAAGSSFFAGNAFPLTVTATPVPAFTLSAASTQLTAKQGSSVTDTITVHPLNGFTGSLNLSAASLPSGITATFSPNSTTSTTALTLTASGSISPGFYPIAIQGTSGSLIANVYFYLTVTPGQFSIGVSSAAPLVLQGNDVTDTLTVTRLNGYTGSVNLAASGLPNGVTASFSPNPATGTSVLTFAATNAILPGTYPITITGTASAQTSSIALALSVLIPTTTVLSINPGGGSLPALSTYTLTSTVSAPSGSIQPTGSVVFSVGPLTYTVALNTSGVATFTDSVSLDETSLTLSAAYLGAPGFSTSQSAVINETITPVAVGTTTTLFINPSGISLAAGAPYVLTAKVKQAYGMATPTTGNVIFNIGGTTQTVALNASGVATCNGTAPASGGLILSAAYQGTPEFSSSTSNTLNETIAADVTTTVLSVSPAGSSIYVGQPTTFTAIVTATGRTSIPNGNVLFYLSANEPPRMVALNSSGVATFTDSFATGAQSYSAGYQGTTLFASSTSNTVNQTILPLPSNTVLSIAPGGGSLAASSSYTLTAQVTPGVSSTEMPHGQIVFTIGSITQMKTVNGSTGTATYTGIAPAAGVLTVSAQYLPASDFLGSTSNTLNETITPSAQLNFSPTNLTFPSTNLNVSSAAQVLTITNSGSVAATVSSYTFSGPNATEFSLGAKTCGTSLAAGASCMLNLAFKPTVAGAATASLVATDSAIGSPQLLPLIGTGSNQPTIAFSPTALIFPSTNVGATATAQVLTVSNSSPLSVTVSSYKFAGISASEFAIQSKTCNSTLAADSSCTLTILFKPTVTGIASATLLATNNAEGSPQSVPLSGTAVLQPMVIFSPAGLTFPSTNLGATSTAQALTIANPSNVAMSVSSYGFSGANANEFSILSKTCGTTLAANASCTISIVFKPKASGTAMANLVATDNATGSPQSLPLGGTGATQSSISFFPTSVVFPLTDIRKTSASQVLTVSNTSSVTLAVSSYVFSGTNAGEMSILSKTCVSSLPANSNCTITLVFRPMAAGAASASLVVTDNASGSPQSVPLSGTGH